MSQEVLLPPEVLLPGAEEDTMPRMSILEHPEDLRSRMLKAMYGFGAVFLLCLLKSDKLFDIVMAPGRDAMQRTKIPGANFVVALLLFGYHRFQ